MSILTKILQHQAAQTSRSSPKYLASMTQVIVPLLALSALASEPKFEFKKVPCAENPLKPPVCGGNFYQASFIDLDDDGDLDAIIGLTNGTIAYFENVGNAKTAIFEQRFDTSNPLNEVDVGFDASLSLSLVDLDNDDDLDAVIGNNDGISYYENVGSAIEPQFEERIEHPLMDVGPSPNLVDLDNDGDLDATTSNSSSSRMSYYENVGSATEAQFEERPEHPLNEVGWSPDTPDLIDLDNDGDLDIVIGNGAGKVSYYENVGSAIEPQFEERPEHPLSGVSVSNIDFSISNTSIFPFPSLVDLDNDGDFDAIIGHYGEVSYYENVGSTTKPQFEELPEHPLSGMIVEKLAIPNLIDLDNDGDFDTVIFDRQNGENKFYENVGNANQPQFEKRLEHPLSKVNMDGNAFFSLVDLDNDGDLDAVMEYRNGKVNYYENVGSATEASFEKQDTKHPLSEVDVSNMGADNPAFLNLVDLDNDGDWDIVVGRGDRQVSYYENVGSATESQFEERLEHPLSEVDAGLNAVLNLVDLDNDGDLDAFIGKYDGQVSYYKNVGSTTKPQFEKHPEHPLSGVDIQGIAPSLVDLDNDGDLDAVIGSYTGQITYYENVGDGTEPQFEEYPEHPLSGENVSSATMIDLDNDGDLDAIIGSGQAIYYKNLGTANQPLFERCQDALNPFCQIIKTKPWTPPSLVDLDNDGDLDAVIGAHDSQINYYENVGSATEQQFEERFEHPLKGVIGIPSFGDLDNDGDWDAVLGDQKGQVSYYENTGNATKPQFEKRLEYHSPNLQTNRMTGSEHASFPSLVDLDSDGDWDVVIAYKNSSVAPFAIEYYENVGSTTKPQFADIQIIMVPQEFNSVDAQGEYYTSKLTSIIDYQVSFVDLDNDSDLDMATFDDSVNHAQVSYYENISNAKQPQFVKKEKSLDFLNGVKGGVPSFVDLDNDGDWDVVTSHNNGQVSYYENVGSVSQPIFDGCRNSSNPFCDVNVESYAYPRLADLDNDGDLDALIGNNSGQLSYYENVGNVNQPRFELRPDHPLSWNKEGNHSIVPSLGDLDNDGDWDVVVGVRDSDGGKLNYYENVGNASQQQFKQRLTHPLDKVQYDAYLNLVDLDNDGDLDAVIGEKSSNVYYYGGYYENVYYENVGSANQAVFEERPDHPLSKIDVNQHNTYPSLVDWDNDGDKDAFIGNRYYVNTEGHVLPPNRALPKGGLYSKPREVNLVCLDCKTIYYTLDGSTPTTDSQVFTEPFNLTESTTLKFLTVDTKEHQSEIITEKYVFDTVPPQITITSPTDRRTRVDIADIRGTADDLGNSGLRRIELNISSAPMYLQGNHRAVFDEEIQWLPVRYSKNWFYDLSAVSFPVGTYKITARAVDNAGNMSTDTVTVFRATQARTDLFLKLNSATLLGGKSLNATGTLVSRRFPAIEEDLKGQKIQLLITAPDGTTWTETTQIQSNIGQFEFQELSGFDQEGAYSFIARFAETDLLTKAESAAQSVLVGQSAGYAVIVMGQIANGEGLDAHNKTTNRIYKTLKERGFEDDNIFYFNPNLNQEVCKKQNEQEQCTPIGIDGQPTVVDFVSQVEGLTARINGSPAPFYFILVNHGDQNGNFYIHDTDSGLEYVTPETWASWLDALEAELNQKALAKPRFVLLGYCYSGKTLESLTKPGRIVISSAADNEVSYKGPKEPDGIRAGEYFMEEFFGHLGHGESFYTAFQNATARTELFTRRGGNSTNAMNRFNDEAVQHPLLALDGNEGYNDLGTILLESTKEVRQADKEEVAKPLDLNELYLGVGADYDTNYVGNPAAIDSVTETLYLEPDETSAELFLMVNNAARVKEATVNIRLPSTELTSESEQSENAVQQVEIQALKEINLLCDFDNRCDRHTDDVIPDLFTEQGKYELYYFVADNETHDISKMWRSVVYKNKADNQPPEPVELLTPTDGGEEQSMILLFSWNATHDPNGDALTYTLIIAEDAEFEHEVYRQEELTQTQLLVSPGTLELIEGSRLELEDATEYFWKVEAVDNFGDFSTSTVWQFQTNYTNGCPASSSNAGINANTICPPGQFLFCPMKPCPNFCFCR